MTPETAPHYDVIVAGGGAAGVGAAVGAAQAGARTLLLEQGPCLGGAATQKNVLTYCGLYTCEEPPRQAVYGVAEQVLAHLHRMGGVTGPLRPGHAVCVMLDAEAVKISLDRVCADAKVDTLLHALLVGANRADDRLVSATYRDHRGEHEVTAEAFVDASGEGDLAFLGGAAVRYGNHGHVQNGTLGVRIGGVRPDADLAARTTAAAIQAAKARGVRPLGSDHGLVVRLPLSNDVVAYLVDESYDALDARSIADAEKHGRAQAWAYLDALRTIPGWEHAYLVSTGPNFGTRESRHVNAHYQMTENDVAGGSRFDDVVALGAWPVEFHPAPGEPTRWGDIKDRRTYDIPLRTLQSVNTANLFAAGRLADGNGGGCSSIRVMGTAFATGHAAGVAASEAARTGRTDAGRVQAELRRQRAVLAYGDLPAGQTS